MFAVNTQGMLCQSRPYYGPSETGLRNSAACGRVRDSLYESDCHSRSRRRTRSLQRVWFWVGIDETPHIRAGENLPMRFGIREAFRTLREEPRRQRNGLREDPGSTLLDLTVQENVLAQSTREVRDSVRVGLDSQPHSGERRGFR